MANGLDLNPQLVRIKLPFSVIQLWNDLEIGQVVKLPAKNNIGINLSPPSPRNPNKTLKLSELRPWGWGASNTPQCPLKQEDEVTILAHRDGGATICLEFTKSMDEIISDSFASELIIVRVEQTFIDSASQAQNVTRSPPIANHKPCDNATNKKLSKKLAKKQSTPKKVIKHESLPKLKLERIDDYESPSKRNKNNTGTMKLPVIISPVSLVSSSSPEKDKKKVLKRRLSDEGSFSSSGDDLSPTKKSRGAKKHKCELCGALFIYFTSYIKHMKRHGGRAAANAQAQANALESKTKAAAIPAPPQKLPKILPKPPEHQHHMMTRRHSMLSSPPVTKNESKVPPLRIGICSKASPLAIGIPPPHIILPRSISPGPIPVFSTTPLIIPKVAPPVLAISAISPPMPSVNPTNPSALPSTAPMVASQTPPNYVQVQEDGTHLLRCEDPLDCWVCLRQFKYPTSFMKHMRIEHELILHVEDQPDRKKRSNVSRSKSIHILNPPETMTSDSFNNNESDDNFRGHQLGQVIALQMKPNGDYVVVDSEMNEIVLGEYLLCSICLTSFNFKMEYIKHMSRSHGVTVKDMTEDNRDNINHHDHSASTSSAPTKLDSQVFQCHVCNKKFFYRIPYEQHLKQIHNVSMVVMDGSQSLNESYICRFCTMVFLYKTSFEKHMQREHGVEITDIYQEDFPSNSQGHGDDSPHEMMFRCNLCLAWFKDSTDLDDHIVLHHPTFTGGRYNTTDNTDSMDNNDYCDDTRIERVKDPDTKLSVIQCDHCSRTFKWRIAYSKHLRTVHADKSNNGNASVDDKLRGNVIKVHEDSVKIGTIKEEFIIERVDDDDDDVVANDSTENVVSDTESAQNVEKDQDNTSEKTSTKSVTSQNDESSEETSSNVVNVTKEGEKNSEITSEKSSETPQNEPQDLSESSKSTEAMTVEKDGGKTSVESCSSAETAENVMESVNDNDTQEKSGEAEDSEKSAESQKNGSPQDLAEPCSGETEKMSGVRENLASKETEKLESNTSSQNDHDNDYTNKVDDKTEPPATADDNLDNADGNIVETDLKSAEIDQHDDHDDLDAVQSGDLGTTDKVTELQKDVNGETSILKENENMLESANGQSENSVSKKYQNDTNGEISMETDTQKKDK